MEMYDLLIKSGRVFDGLGSPSAVGDIAILKGKVVAISDAPIPESRAARVIDAVNKWVVPGFVDPHTHYDAEVLVAPGLEESVRHGVTTVFFGSCSLSTVHSTPLDCADLFSRVEALPRPYVIEALESSKTWTNAKDYIRYLESLPLGPNVACLLGHSDVRASVMGLGRATDPAVRPERDELKKMLTHVEDAIDAGFLGLSSMQATIDKLDGERYRSRALPSTFARRGELNALNSVLRRRNRVLQTAPNFRKIWNVPAIFLASIGSWFLRKPLKTSLLTAVDAKSLRFVAWAIVTFTVIFNRIFRANVRWQHLPVRFYLYADGIDQVVFEEFGAGSAALHLRTEMERNELFQHEGYRRWFRRACDNRFEPKVWHRNFREAEIVGCPDEGVVGLTFGQVADKRGGIHPVDAFLDLIVMHGKALRWTTTIANDRPKVLNWMSAHPSVQIGFADSGAHLRQMAYYNAPIRLLRRIREAEAQGTPFMTVERAVHRVTGELASWFDIDAGTLRVGARADIAIIDPSALDASVDGTYEAPMPKFPGFMRMVNRSGAAVSATLIGGEVVFENGTFAPTYGKTRRTGSFLPVGKPVSAVRPAAGTRTRAA